MKDHTFWAPCEIRIKIKGLFKILSISFFFLLHYIKILFLFFVLKFKFVYYFSWMSRLFYYFHCFFGMKCKTIFSNTALLKLFFINIKEWNTETIKSKNLKTLDWLSRFKHNNPNGPSCKSKPKGQTKMLRNINNTKTIKSKTSKTPNWLSKFKHNNPMGLLVNQNRKDKPKC